MVYNVFRLSFGRFSVKKNQSTTKKIVMTALFTALTMVSTMLIRIPLPMGYVHLGDAFVLLSAFVLGPIWGTISAGVGSALADMVGYVAYAPATLIIKALMAFVAWLTAQALAKVFKNKILAQSLAGVIATLLMTAGYFLYEGALYATVGVALVNVPWSLLQGAVGIVVSVAVFRIISAVGVLHIFTWRD
jgi:uncharacterized membrane protein